MIEAAVVRYQEKEWEERVSDRIEEKRRHRPRGHVITICPPCCKPVYTGTPRWISVLCGWWRQLKLVKSSKKIWQNILSSLSSNPSFSFSSHFSRRTLEVLVWQGDARHQGSAGLCREANLQKLPRISLRMPRGRRTIASERQSGLGWCYRGSCPEEKGEIKRKNYL